MFWGALLVVVVVGGKKKKKRRGDVKETKERRNPATG